MKQLMAFCLLSFPLAVIAQVNPYLEVINLPPNHYYGKVKKVVAKGYYVGNDLNDTLCKGKSIGGMVYTFDTAGHLLRDLELYPDGWKPPRNYRRRDDYVNSIYEYYGRDSMALVATDRKGRRYPLEKTANFYNGNQLVMQVYYKLSRIMTGKTINYFDIKGYVIGQTYYNERDEGYFITYKNDARGNHIEISSQVAGEKPKLRYKRQYDEHDNPILVAEGGYENTPTLYRYTYDAHGNWIRSVEYAGRPYSVTIRKITYY